MSCKGRIKREIVIQCIEKRNKGNTDDPYI